MPDFAPPFAADEAARVVDPDFEADDAFEPDDDDLAGLFVDFVPVDFVPVDFVAADVERAFVVELDDLELLLLERLRFGLSSPIGSALPTAFTAPPAAPPTLPAILPAVRPTCLTTFPGSGM